MSHTVMNGLGLYPATAVVALLLGACSSAPDCAADANLNQVVKIIGQNAPPGMMAMLETPTGKAMLVASPRKDSMDDHYLRAGQNMFKASTHRFEAIRITNKDAGTGAVQCAAKITVTFPNGEGTHTSEVKYQVEKTADGGSYVSVFF